MIRQCIEYGYPSFEFYHKCVHHFGSVAGCSHLHTGPFSNMSRGSNVPARQLLAVSRGCSLSTIANILQVASSIGVESDVQAADLVRKLKKEVDVHTPYGKTIVVVKLACENEPDLEWPIINPMALLYQMCVENNALGDMLKNLNTDTCRIALYSDETTPGNAQHPDVPKESQCFYWTIVELPSWYRSRQSGWWYFSVMKTSDQDLVNGGLSGIMRIVIRCFFLNMVTV